MTFSSVALAWLDVSSFRVLPFLAYALIAPRFCSRARVASALALFGMLGLCAAAGVSGAGIACGIGAQCYVAASACAVHRLALARSCGQLTRPALVTVVVFGYLVLPGLALPSEWSGYFLVLGWEAALAAYSYVVEAARKPQSASVGECSFFLTVNPLLVYTPRAQLCSQPVSLGRGIGRAIVGLGVMALSIPLSAPRELPGAAALGQLQGYSAFIVNGVLVFAGRYAALSGIASLQIGLMRAIGYCIPERYVYPLAARSPEEFWRRWNVYVGDWFKHYVFIPWGLRLQRSEQPLLRRAGGRIALAATLLLIGVYHDVYVYSAELHVRGVGTAAFAFAAAVMIGWSWLSRAGARWLARTRQSSAHSLAQRARRPLAHLAMAHLICALLWLFARS